MPERHFSGLRSKVKPWKRKMAAAMNRNKTWPEKILWARLRDNQLGVTFQSQSILYGYIADYFCSKAGLCVEVDGPCHLSRKVYDLHRDEVLAKKGIKTIRFTAQEVQNNVAAVVILIQDQVRKRMA